MPEATVRWIEGTQLVASSGSGHGLVLDTPVEAGGAGSGPSPMELLLVAQAGCTAMDVVHILRDKMRKAMTGLEVEVRGERADAVPRIYTRVELRYRVRGRGLEEKDVARAISLSIEKYCSVSVMVARTAALDVHYEIENEDGGAVTKGSLPVPSPTA